ncbi:MAG: hypothetical protein V3W20_12580 [Candidatus Neomarinimicrobiota bacterium]
MEPISSSQASALGHQLSRQYQELSTKMYGLERRLEEIKKLEEKIDAILLKLNEIKWEQHEG